jgi:hypothetical protein
MFVPIRVTGFFPAPAQIVEIRFLELAGILHDGIVADDTPCPIHIPRIILENGMGLVVQVFKVKQIAVLAIAQEFQPGAQPGFIERDAAVGTETAKVENVTCEVAQSAIGFDQFHGKQLAIHLL